MSVTRMLVLGAVRIFQPTHGYFVRRELASWQVADWAHLNPGSIYNALRTLAKERMLVEEEAADLAAGEKPRTEYSLTMDGEVEFLRLVRLGLWELHPYEPEWLQAGISFWGALHRDEVAAALRARSNLLSARITGTDFAIRGFEDGSAAGTPSHVRETFDLTRRILRAEHEWCVSAAEHIEGGAYGFAGEDPRLQMPRVHPHRKSGSGWDA